MCVGERKRAKHEQGKKKTGGKFRLSGEMSRPIAAGNDPPLYLRLGR